MKQFEIKKEEMDKWLDSKDLKKGFFTVEHDTSKRDYYSYSDDAEFNERIVVDYYFWVKGLKMGSLLDIPEDTSYFDYLLYNEYIEFKDSLTLATFEWSNGEERSQTLSTILITIEGLFIINTLAIQVTVRLKNTLIYVNQKLWKTLRNFGPMIGVILMLKHL